MRALKPKSFLHSFIIFDRVPPRKEGSDPIVYFQYSINQEEQTKNEFINQVGAIIAFITFCQRFRTDAPCDYIFTKVHEIAMQELSGSIWMAVILTSEKPENRSLLNSILTHFRNMFSLFFVSLKPLHEAPLVADQKILSALPQAFPTILHSVDWNKLDFRYMFNSYIPQPFNPQINISQVCQQFLNTNSDLFDKIVVMYRHNRIVYSSFDDLDITRTLAFSMHRRFSHLFFHNPQRESDELTWLIGLYINSSGQTSIYQQPIIYNGHHHLLVAFRIGSFKIILTEKADIQLSEKILFSIPRRIQPIQQLLCKKNLVFKSNSIPIPYAIVTNDYVKHKMTYESFNIDAVADSYMDKNLIKSHDYAKMYAKNATIAIPVLNKYFVLCKRSIENDELKETILYSQPNPGGISHNLKISSFLIAPKDSKSDTTDCLLI